MNMGTTKDLKLETLPFRFHSWYGYEYDCKKFGGPIIDSHGDVSKEYNA